MKTIKLVQPRRLITGLGIATLGILMGAASLYLGFYSHYVVGSCIIMLAGFIAFGLGVRMIFQSAAQK